MSTARRAAALIVVWAGCLTIVGCGGNSEPATAVTDTPSSTEPVVTSTVEVTTTVAAASPLEEQFAMGGTGKQVVELPEGNRRVIVHATGDGQGPFTIDALNANGDLVESLAFSPPGTSYDGLQLITTPIEDVVALAVNAKGDWTVELLDIDQVSVVGDDFAGIGDSVVRYNGAGGEATVTSSGLGGRFSVQAEDGRYVVPTTREPYEGTETMQPGPVLVEVSSRGSWTVSVASSANPPGSTVPAGTTIDPATAALVDDCFELWIEAQRLGAQGRFTEEARRAALQPMFESCQAALDAVEPLALRSPLRSPLRVLHDVVFQVSFLGTTVLAMMQPCDPECVLTPADQASFLQLTPDVNDVPDALYGYLGGNSSAPTIAVIPGLAVSG